MRWHLPTGESDRISLNGIQRFVDVKMQSDHVATAIKFWFQTTE